MADRFYGYQYDTNPRKLNSQYAPYRNSESFYETQEKTNSQYEKKHVVNRSKTKNVQKKSKNVRFDKDFSKNEQNEKTTKMSKAKVKVRLRIVLFLMAGFSVLFAISYQNSLISESFNKKEQYKKEMEALSKTNQQIEVSIENNLNLNVIEQQAKEKIGMQKLNNDQKIYVSLPKQDYVAPASEQIVIEEEMNFFQKLVSFFN